MEYFDQELNEIDERCETVFGDLGTYPRQQAKRFHFRLFDDRDCILN